MTVDIYIFWQFPMWYIVSITKMFQPVVLDSFISSHDIIIGRLPFLLHDKHADFNKKGRARSGGRGIDSWARER